MTYNKKYQRSNICYKCKLRITCNGNLDYECIQAEKHLYYTKEEIDAHFSRWDIAYNR